MRGANPRTINKQSFKKKLFMLELKIYKFIFTMINSKEDDQPE